MITCGMEYLQPVYEYFHRELLKRRFLMLDETPTQVLKKDGRRAETKSYFWVIRTGEDSLNPIVLYNYTATRAGENIKNFLEGMEDGAEGSMAAAVYEGTRPLLLEIQALAAPCNVGFARRSAIGVELSRLNMIIAVLERKAGISLINHDIYVGLNTKSPLKVFS